MSVKCFNVRIFSNFYYNIAFIGILQKLAYVSRECMKKIQGHVFSLCEKRRKITKKREMKLAPFYINADDNFTSLIRKALQGQSINRSTKGL